jgi:hypothetical protein
MIMNVILALLLSQIAIHDEGVRVGSVRRLDFTGAGVTCSSGSLQVSCAIPGGAGGGAPTTSQYWVGAADATLSAEHNLGALGTGLVINTAGIPSAFAGATCSAPDVLRSLSASGTPTCVQLRLDQLAAPNQNQTWAMGDNHLQFNWNAPVVGGGFDGAIEFQVQGAFTGHFMHIHQLTGDPGAGTHLLHIEATDADVLPLHVQPATTGTRAALVEGYMDVSGVINATAGVVGNVTGTASGNALTAHSHTTTEISGLDAGADFSAGTLPQSRGGMGAASLTCAGTDKVTCNGTVCSCSTDLTGGGVDLSASEFVTFAANANLSAERVLTAGTNTSVDVGTAGQVKINVSGLEPAGAFSGVGTCTNQFARVLNDTAAPTCAGVGVADFTANQGTTTQVLHGNAAGQPSWGALVTADLPTVAVTKGGTNLTTIAANQVWVGTAADTVAVKTIPSCSNATTSKLLYDNATQTFSCGTDQTSAGGASVAGTKTMLTATWASSATANTLGIVGTGTVPLTSPTYAAAAPFAFHCTIATTRPATTNGPRYGIQSSGTVTRISWRTEVGLAATTQTLTKGLALATGTCAGGCSTAMTTGTVAQVMQDEIFGTGVMNATGTLSLVMAPSAAAANTAQIGSVCIWY